MARWEPEQTVTQSVLERLIDREPGAQSEAAPTRAQTVRLLRASVRRDLEWLLNTRRTPAAADEEYPEVAKSVYNYGLPDLNALNWESSRDRTRLARAVQEALNVFEPRLRGIQVVPLEPVAGAPHVMRFQIEGLLEMDPAPEHIVFDTTLQLSSGEYQVKGDSNAG
jgi:type VI secretion system protein ImpF